MNSFRVQVQADKWPTDYTVTATSWPVAVARALRIWKKSAGKGTRTDQLTIKAHKVVSVSE